jgi:hypothetical protein
MVHLDHTVHPRWVPESLVEHDDVHMWLPFYHLEKHVKKESEV